MKCNACGSSFEGTPEWCPSCGAPRGPARPRRRSALTLVLILVVTLGALAAIGVVLSRGQGRLEGVGVDSDAPPSGPGPAVWRPTQTQLARAPIAWAVSAPDASSSYEPKRRGPSQVAGPPNVWPRLDDDAHAWSPKHQNGGTQWIDLAWPGPVRARAVLVVETLHPGTVVEIQGRSSGKPVTLWSGSAPTKDAPAGSILTVPLARPTRVTKLRVVLDTSLVAGRNEIDAVGLVRSTP